jgi:hypothetical protein
MVSDILEGNPGPGLTTLFFTFCRQHQLIIQFEVDLAPVISYCSADPVRIMKGRFFRFNPQKEN